MRRRRDEPGWARPEASTGRGRALAARFPAGVTMPSPSCDHRRDEVRHARPPPWPTDFVVRTTTPVGETSSLRVSLVGGFDHRSLPLDAIGLGLALVLATAGVGRAASAPLRRTIEEGIVTPAKAGEDWEIEEIPPGS